MERDLRALREREPSNICGIAAATVAAGVASAAGAVYGASKQAKAAKRGQDVQQHMFDLTRGDLMPYNLGGQQAFTEANKLLMGSPSEVQARLEALPGYQFTKQQGLKAVTNSATARGLGVSGPAFRGAARYVTGLADSTYGGQFGRLLESAKVGENAAAQTGVAATTTGQGIANSLIQGGNAVAGGAAGLANGIGTGLLGYGMYGGFGGGGGGGGTGTFTGIDPSDPVYGVI